MRILLMLWAGLLILAASCAPEIRDVSYDGGAMHLIIGECENKDGKDPTFSCAKPKECKQYCCECTNGTSYSVAVCRAEDGCAAIGTACNVAKDEACD